MALKNHENPEDRLILELLEARDIEDLDTESRETSLSDRELERAYVELLGLLPDALEPKPPSREVKSRVMAAVAGSGSRDIEPIDRDVRRLSAVPTGRPMAETAPGTAANDNRFRSFLVAAVVALMMVGVSGWFYLQLDRQRDMVTQLKDELRATNLRLEELNDGRRDMVASLRDVGMMESIPVEWCPLRPAGENPPQPDAHGSLLLVKEHGRWSVRLHNLEAAAGDRVYVLWFLNEDQPLKKVSLGRGDRPVRIAATGLPELMTAAAVTLEASTETAEPSGPRILYGHNREMDRL